VFVAFNIDHWVCIEAAYAALAFRRFNNLPYPDDDEGSICSYDSMAYSILHSYLREQGFTTTGAQYSTDIVKSEAISYLWTFSIQQETYRGRNIHGLHLA